MTTVIELKDVSKVFTDADQPTQALHHIDIKVEQGEFVAIMGPSGSGKSTLLNIIGLLDIPTSGEYILDGQVVRAQSESRLAKIRRDKIGFIFQSFNLLPRYSALQNVELPMIYAGLRPKDRRRLATQLLERVGLGEKLKQRPHQLSGGQVQRVAIARSLANEPSLILADEPTGNLDTKSSDEVMKILRRLNRDGSTIVLVTHNPDLAEQADRTIKIVDGRVAGAKR